MTFDGKAFGQEVVAAVKAHVDQSLAPVIDRLAAVEKAISAALTDADMDAVKSDVESLRKAIASLPVSVAPELPDIPAMVADAVAALPEPEPGKSVTLDDVRPLIEEAAQKAVAVLPVPEAKEVDMGAVGATIAAEVERVLSGWERPQDGKSVKAEELAPIVAECVQKAVDALPKPKDGCGIRDLLIDREGALVATMDDGRMKNLGAVVGRDGVDVDMAAVKQAILDEVKAIPRPKDGADGFSLKHFDATLMDDGRTVLLSFEDGERSYKVELGFPIVLDRGVFKEDGSYSKGDGVTWGGCFWIAQMDNPEGKPDSGKGWRLAVKKGRDGKDYLPRPDNGPAKVKV